MAAQTVTAASAGWSCVTINGDTQWSAWNARGGMHGVAATIDEARAKAAAASEILNGSDV